MRLLDNRKIVVEGIDSIILRVYQNITPETRLEEVAEIVTANSGELAELTGLDIDIQIARAIGYQAREMISSDGQIKKRNSGQFYASHPVCVAAIAAHLAGEYGFAEDIRREAIMISLLHDVIEEGERVEGFRQIKDNLGCEEIIAASIEFLDIPDINYKYADSLDPMLKPYLIFAHSIARVRNDAIRLAELGDRFDGVCELDFILRKPIEERHSQLVKALAKWSYMVETVCDSSPYLAKIPNLYKSLERRAAQDPRFLEAEHILEQATETKVLMSRVGREHTDLFDKELERYFAKIGINTKLFYREK